MVLPADIRSCQGCIQMVFAKMTPQCMCTPLDWATQGIQLARDLVSFWAWISLHSKDETFTVKFIRERNFQLVFFGKAKADYSCLLTLWQQKNAKTQNNFLRTARVLIPSRRALYLVPTDLFDAHLGLLWLLRCLALKSLLQQKGPKSTQDCNLASWHVEFVELFHVVDNVLCCNQDFQILTKEYHMPGKACIVKSQTSGPGPGSIER